MHIDVMDGRFVPQISYGQPVVSALRPHTELPFDVHLMIEQPENHIDSFIRAGADYLTFHWENTVHHHRIIGRIHDAGKKAGIAVVPSTPIAVLEEILPYLDLVLVMTVNPGFGGQAFIPGCARKITELRRIKAERGYGFLISADGGINGQTLAAVLDAGTDVVVSGSAFFSGTLGWEL